MDIAKGPHKWTRSLRADEKGHAVCVTPGGPQRFTAVSESGLYRLVLRSDKPAARTFQDWVTRDVLPAIRKDQQGLEFARPSSP